MSCIPILGEVFQNSEGYLELRQASLVESFWKNCWRLLFAKRLHCRCATGCSKYASGVVLLYSICVIRILAWPFWSSCPEVFCKKGVLEILQNSQENACTRDSFLIKLQANFINEESLARVFSCKFWEKTPFLKTPFLQNTSGGCIKIFFRRNALFSKYMGWRIAAL